MRVKKGCPLCEEDVHGSSETGYYCRSCNLIFNKRHVVFRHSREELKMLIDAHFGEFSGKGMQDLKDDDHRLELAGEIQRAATSINELRQSVDETKRMLEEAEAGRPVTVPDRMPRTAPVLKKLKENVKIKKEKKIKKAGKILKNEKIKNKAKTKKGAKKRAFMRAQSARKRITKRELTKVPPPRGLDDII